MIKGLLFYAIEAQGNVTSAKAKPNDDHVRVKLLTNTFLRIRIYPKYFYFAE